MRSLLICLNVCLLIWPTISCAQNKAEPIGAVSQSQETVDAPFGAEKLRLGIFAHNFGVVASRVEHGVDANAELSFKPIDALWGAEPTHGLMLNGIGNTSYLYTGFSWEWDVFEDGQRSGLFVIPFFGLAIHDGKREPEPKRRGLGCQLLFREAIEIGWRFNKETLDSSQAWAISVLTDHLSHGGLCEDRNQGLDNTGIRFHWYY